MIKKRDSESLIEKAESLLSEEKKMKKKVKKMKEEAEKIKSMFPVSLSEISLSLILLISEKGHNNLLKDQQRAITTVSVSEGRDRSKYTLANVTVRRVIPLY